MPNQFLFKSRLICVAVIDHPDDAVPLAEALLTGGLSCVEITFRTLGAAEAISRIRKNLPEVVVGAGTLLTAENVNEAVDAGAQFGVSPGLCEGVSNTAKENRLPWFPGVLTPTEVMRAREMGWNQLKFFPAETFGGTDALKTLAGPFGHTGIQFVPTGGITAANVQSYLAVPQVVAVGGSWMAERKLIAQKAWDKIAGLSAMAALATR